MCAVCALSCETSLLWSMSAPPAVALTTFTPLATMASEELTMLTPAAPFNTLPATVTEPVLLSVTVES